MNSTREAFDVLEQCALVFGNSFRNPVPFLFWWVQLWILLAHYYRTPVGPLDWRNLITYHTVVLLYTILQRIYTTVDKAGASSCSN